MRLLVFSERWTNISNVSFQQTVWPVSVFNGGPMWEMAVGLNAYY